MGITRRKLLQHVGQVTMGSKLAANPLLGAPAMAQGHHQFDGPPPPDQLPGTEPLTFAGDPAKELVDGMRRFAVRETSAAMEHRAAHWHRDYSSRQAYEASVAPNRERFSQVIGLRDKRVPDSSPWFEGPVGSPEIVAEGAGYTVRAVRWPVLKGVDGEGLLLQPAQPPIARIVALPDADWPPEALAGLAEGVPPEAQFARRLAESGCLVLIPTLIDRQDTWSANPRLNLYNNFPHREYIYRMAYELGRHIIGYEVQKVMAAVDWFTRSTPAAPIGVIGYGEGAVLAFYSAVVDQRIEAAAVSGYFQSRQEVWQEPLYRNVWTLLYEFGDAELAGLIAPRGLVVEAAHGVEIAGPPPHGMDSEGHNRLDVAAPGRLVSPALDDVHAEVERARPFFHGLDVQDKLVLVTSGTDGQGPPGSEQALRHLLSLLGAKGAVKRPGAAPRDRRAPFDPLPRLHRQFEQLVSFTQTQVIDCEQERTAFWSKADASSVQKWKDSTQWYRDYLWQEIFGKLPDPSGPITAQSRKIYQEVNWTGYEVMLPIWPDIFAYGILLLPIAMDPGERRPVVVCQHGINGRPQDVIKGGRVAEHAYHHFGAVLADHGFVVFCPQAPYFEDPKYHHVYRLSNPLKLSLYSYILTQNQRILDWLSQQPFVDPEHIGFYGLSYGGKSAVRVPPLLDKYSLSICSGDFNEWIWKICRIDNKVSYMFNPAFELGEFNLGNTFNYAEMASLMTPRPFMVERGHEDGVSVDWWVAYEYAKVRRHYDEMNLGDRTRIDFFNGPHTIHGISTFDFLHRFLEWGEPYKT